MNSTTTAPVNRPRGVSGYFVFSFLILVAGIYTDINVTVGTGRAPMVSALPGMLLLSAFIVRKVLPSGWRSLILYPSGLLCLGFLSPAPLDNLTSHIFATVQLLYSLLIGFTAGRCLLTLGRQRVFMGLQFVIPVFIVLLAAELAFSPLRALVRDYMGLYGRELTDAVINRDVSISGGYRPKFFTSETSYVALSAVLLLTGYIWTGTRQVRFFIALMYAGVLAVLIRSPIVVLFGPILFATLIQPDVDDRGNRRRSFGLVYMIGVGLILISALVVTFGSEFYRGRLESIRSGSDYSTTYRTYGSLAAGINVANEYPFFGVGPGSIDLAEDMIITTEIAAGVPKGAVEAEWRGSVNNLLAFCLVIFGYLGTAIVLLAFVKLVNSCSLPPRFALWISIAVFSLCYGSIYTPKFGVTVLVLTALARLSLVARWSADILPNMGAQTSHL